MHYILYFKYILCAQASTNVNVSTSSSIQFIFTKSGHLPTECIWQYPVYHNLKYDTNH